MVIKKIISKNKKSNLKKIIYIQISRNNEIKIEKF